ncbi:HD domain-containing protein [Mariniblastus fucicola]|uniref:HD domain protein n=1 Tax=Mariniblastus fucicola TaxID=980251 RepID=A0A5B9PC36_9BACT|nr:HD domain-containing protein [Mariniblastus fucicola]QEG22735.1 HD domain protein [Mariniblastus fucicola]
MNELLSIPEIQSLEVSDGLLRIPSQIDVPVTSRVTRIIDTPVFQRLKRISQLGLVAFVYPAANHSRFEHSLGVFRNCLLFVKQLAWQPRFCELVSAEQVEALLLAALLHDVGHWPFCHPIEDMGLDGVPRHENLAQQWLADDELQSCIGEDWNACPELVTRIITRKTETKSERLLASILSGPIDIDKLDYLYRDSLHAGVPYGQNLDTARLVRSLCLNESGDALAISTKGRTAAELMVFARYVMFSEIYWHHAVRSATAMLQRAFFRSKSAAEPVDWEKEFQLGESDFVLGWRARSQQSESVHSLLEGLFSQRRRLYKRAANFSFVENESLYRALAQRKYADLTDVGEQLAKAIAIECGQELDADDVLIDAPPAKLEVQFNIDIFDARSESWRPLGEVSPMIHTLAKKQFDDYVKRVRVFCKPELAATLADIDIVKLLEGIV